MVEDLRYSTNSRELGRCILMSYLSKLNTIQKIHCALLAEDNFSELKLLQLAMEDSGLGEIIDYSIAHDGEQAIKYLQGEKKIDFVLLALNMPRVPGTKVLEYVNVDLPEQRPVIIVFSNSDHPKDIYECRALGADAYLQKPKDFNLLLHFCEVLKKSLIECGTIDIAFINAYHPELRI